MRSLASDLHGAGPDLLLSMSELSRVHWKPGHRQGELHVEINGVEDGSYELRSIDDDIDQEDDHRLPSQGTPRSRTPAVHLSRVGTYADAYIQRNM